MPPPNAPVLEFLRHRRSHPARTLRAPVPGRDELRVLLTAAARSPDHGKLEPWRFIVLEKPALTRLARLAEERAPHLDVPPEKVAKGVAQYDNADLAVAVISVPRASDKVPAFEQILSAGAVCLSLLNAALAAGWGANWLTGWAVQDPEFRARALGLAPSESVAGVIFIGTPSHTPPDRPRPDIDAISTWMER